MNRPRPRLLAPVAAALLAAASPAPAAANRYLVMPFENLSGEPSLSWIGEAVAMSLADRLELLGMRTVARGERVEALDAAGLPPAASLSLASILRLADSVRAARVVTGTFTYDPLRGVEVSARLLDAGHRRQLWEGRRSTTLAGIFALMDPLVLEAAAEERRAGAAARERLGSFGDPPLPVYEVIVRGLQEKGADRRVESLEKGLALYPRSAPLLRALAFALADAGRGDEALIRLDGIPEEGIADAWRLHLLRARILTSQDRAPAAFEALSRSIRAADSAEAHILLAHLNEAAGDRPRATIEVDLAAGLDPGHPDLAELRARLARPPVPRPAPAPASPTPGR